MNNLLSITPVTNSKDTQALRKLYDSCEIQVRSLESLGVVTGTYSSLLCPILLKIIPRNIVLEFNKQQDGETDWDITNLLKLLRLEVESRERTEQLTNSTKEAFINRDIREKANKGDHHSNYRGYQNRNRVPTAAALNTAVKPACLYCNGENHRENDCTDLTVDQKREFIQKEQRCFVCLKKYHRAKFCRSKIVCYKCKRRHHTSICQKNITDEQGSEQQAIVATVPSVQQGIQTMLLQTVKASAVGIKGDAVVRCLLDSGSQRTFILEKLSRALKLPVIGEETLSIHTFGSERPLQVTRKIVMVTLKSVLNPEVSIQCEALETPNISGAVVEIPGKEIEHKLNMLGLQLADTPSRQCSLNEKIGLIIGTDYYWKIITGKVIRLTESLVALETLFGWCIHGPSGYTTESNVIGSFSVMKIMVQQEDQLVSTQLQKFWDLETLGINSENTTKICEQDVLNTFEASIAYANNRYKVQFPWKYESTGILPDNRKIAEKRLESLLNRLSKDIPLLVQYDEVINEYLAEGIIEEVTDEVEANSLIYYMPHRAVYKKQRATTQIRVVFDASSHEKGKPSLNDCLFSGPSLLPDILHLLLKFRLNQVAFTADIERAFLQLELHETDRDVTRFLWYEDPLKAPEGQRKIKTFRFSRVPFGVTASPFLLAATVKHHVKKYERKFPDASNLLMESLYVDDLLGGSDCPKKGYDISRDATNIMACASMNLRKWRTNSDALRTSWRNQGTDSKEFTQLENSEHGTPVKVLGIGWCTERDEFLFGIQELISFLHAKTDTKRFILQSAGRIYDPVGYLTPYTVRVKCLFQELWLMGVNWDDSLPRPVQELWDEWCSELKQVTEIRIPRYYFSDVKKAQLVNIQLHTFSDASLKAYGAVVYLRASTEDGQVITKLVCSKGRVAPLKKLTVPKLELLGALVAARLAKYVEGSLGITSSSFLWTDSTVVYYWIHNHASKYKPFVANRISEIQKLSELANWSHCAGEDNPADLLTRGESASRLVKSDVWWNGPFWLRNSKENWPRKPKTDNKTEMPTDVLSLITKCKLVKEREPLFSIDKYSTLNKVLRITAYIVRFLHNARSANERTGGPLTAEEINEAERYWVKHSQIVHFSKDICSLQSGNKLSADSKLQSYKPFLDDDGLLRVGGRLDFAELSFQNKHPLILPEKAKLTDLIIRADHNKIFHGGVSHTLAHVRQKFWVPRGRQIVKKVLRNCLICRRFSAKPAVEISGQLPKERVQQAPPFSATGVDFAGPLYLKGASQTEKGYIALFTCASTRAVHLELVSDLSTDKFLLAFRRFVSRRGTCSILISDNAKTFKRAEQDLKRLWNQVQLPEVRDFLSNARISWKFIVENAPWWGGFYERLVRTVKSSLRKVLGKASLSFEEMTTLLTEIEAAINTRPITYTYSETREPEPLTPAKFLIGENIGQIPYQQSDSQPEVSTRVALTKRLKYRKLMLQRLWDQWVKQYLLELRTAHHLPKTNGSNKIKIDDVVILEQPKINRMFWPLGVVTQTFTGRDGRIRSCLIRTKKGLVRRPVNAIYRLEIRDEEEHTEKK